jgi:hypothetical protein
MRSLLLLIALAVCLSGCGSSQGRVKGQVVENGQPVSIDGQAALMFYLLGDDGKPNPAKSYPIPLNPDGSFELVASGGELPPGKYMVTFDINPMSAGSLARFKGRFPYPDSPLRQEVKPGTNTVTVDLGQAAS